MQKPLGIQKCDGRTNGRTDRPTNRHGKVQSPVSATNDISLIIKSAYFSFFDDPNTTRKNLEVETRKRGFIYLQFQNGPRFCYS